ncbi:MAG: purine-nucleoside phosphorylase [Clostridia bacterium]|nr:purine-nucleoside phosphorylase [Clostridia bacterium]
MTPHNTAEKGQIAKTVLMPGDPLRAKWIAETFLTDAVCFNQTRGMLGYTGTYKGKRVSVMGHGMGIPSIGIYTYELFHFYDVENIIRVGSIGGLDTSLELGDLIIAQGACTDSNYAAQYELPGTFAPICDYGLLKLADKTAEAKGLNVRVGNVLASDCFYRANPSANEKWRSMGVLGIEMECNALYLNAAYAHKRALGILTVSDIIGDDSRCMSPEERQTTLRSMIEVALDVAVQLED